MEIKPQSKRTRMRGLMIASTLLMFAAGALGNANEPNTLSTAEQLAGWKLLFDGKTTDGWRVYRKEEVSSGWQVIDGALVRTREKTAGDLITKEKYQYFDLSLEFRIDGGGNSGLIFGVTEEYDKSWQSGPEIQIYDRPGADAKHRTGALYDLIPAAQDAARPAGEWNELRLHLGPDGGELQINGVRYYKFKIGNNDWSKRLAKSKFSRYPNFSKAAAGHLCLQDHGNEVSFRNLKIRQIPASGEVTNPVTGTLAMRPVKVFSKVTWKGWSPVDDQGRPRALRPIVLTHAGDGSGRIFMATQRGVIHMIRKTEEEQTSQVFLDLRDRVSYKDRENEEGLLGLAFHPKFKQTGRIYAYYTSSKAPHTSVVSSFQVSKKNPNQVDPDSELEILRIPQPFWNHNGGTIAFGPDGYLYVGLGDGGAANDPHGNGQNLQTWLGSILRIDIDKRTSSSNYSVPSDNPFVGVKGARKEIYAFGLRNVWRIAFDRANGDLWAGDVGQNSWEEIHLIRSGGNYGWNLREGTHPFGKKLTPSNVKVESPIWEYDHTVGKSITGGVVYRGKKFPELSGCYLYADYVTGKLWALKYDRKANKVTGNLSIPSSPLPVISFGEDEDGEAYFMVVASDGKGIYSFEKTR